MSRRVPCPRNRGFHRGLKRGDRGDNGTFTGQARTNFPFEDFDLEVPRVAILLSVENNIRLELELTGSVS
jgi:hypothetical protein